MPPTPITAVVMKHLQLSSLSRIANATVMSDLTGLMVSFGQPWCLIGGFAVVAHGYHRTTDDIDLLVACTREAFARLRLLANGGGFGASQSATGTIQRMIHGATHTEVEVLWADTPKQVAAATRAKPVHVLGYKVPVIGLEDLLVQKIDVAEANPGRRNKDWADVNGLLGAVPARGIPGIVSAVTPQISERAAKTLQGYADLITNR